jgi:hypothetical protein
MIDIKNKKYELIDIGGDDRTLMFSDDYYMYLLGYSLSSENDDEAEELREVNNISKEDFYSIKLETIKDITEDDNKKIAYMANYIYKNHKEARKLLDDNDYSEYFTDKHFVSNSPDNYILKYKPAKCLYDNKMINPYIKHIYEIATGGAEHTVYFGEY